MDWKRLIGVVLVAGWAAPALADNNGCEIVAPEVRKTTLYAGFSESKMCKAGLPALWQGVPENAVSVMRFTFTSGHLLFWRSVTITQLPDGSGWLEVVGGGFERRDVRSPWVDLRPVRRRLSAEALSNLAALAEQTGTFDHAVGSWHAGDPADVIYLHCQTLEMERADAVGYRFSSINIGCLRPSRLMPLVDAIIDRADIGMVRSNWAGYE